MDSNLQYRAVPGNRRAPLRDRRPLTLGAGRRARSPTLPPLDRDYRSVSGLRPRHRLLEVGEALAQPELQPGVRRH
jgi:hypothetical protein